MDAGFIGCAFAWCAIADEEAAIGGIVGMESQAQQAALVVARGECDELVGDIEKRCLEQCVIVEDADGAALFDDEEAIGVIVGRCNDLGALESIGNEFEFETDGAGLDLAGIADAVVVGVALIGVGVVGAVILGIADGIIVEVGALGV